MSAYSPFSGGLSLTSTIRLSPQAPLLAPNVHITRRLRSAKVLRVG